MRKDATPWSARDATWSMVIAGIDSDPQQAGALKRWGRAYWEAVHPFNPGGAYVNFMMDDEGEARVQGDLWRQLRAARGDEEEIRPGQPLPREPEHPPAA